MHAVAALGSDWATSSSVPSDTLVNRANFADMLAEAAASTDATRDIPTVTLGQMVHLIATAALPVPTQTAAPVVSAPTVASRLMPPAPAAAPAPLPRGPQPAAEPAHPWVTPADGPVTSRFGLRVHPITGQRKAHNGIDIAAPTGTPVRAAAAGTVTFAGRQGGYGNLVVIRHVDGSETRYAHQHTLGVRSGQVVAAGMQLGTVGSTGASTGPHLHFELRRDGDPVDPSFILRT